MKPAEHSLYRDSLGDIKARVRQAQHSAVLSANGEMTQDRTLVEYALLNIQKPIGVAEYELTRALPKELANSLPSVEGMEAELSESLKGGTE